MAPHSLSPAWVRLDYRSVYGTHVAIMPTKDWIATSITGQMGSYQAWNTVPVDAEDMIDRMVAELVKQHVVSTSFDLATIYTQATTTAAIFPRATKTLTAVGTSGAIGPQMAIQSNMNARSQLGGPCKLIFLDASARNMQMTKISPVSFTVEMNLLVAEWTDPANAWAARDDSKPATALSWTMTENNELRKRYRKG